MWKIVETSYTFRAVFVVRSLGIAVCHSSCTHCTCMSFQPLCRAYRPLPILNALSSSRPPLPRCHHPTLLGLTTTSSQYPSSTKSLQRRRRRRRRRQHQHQHRCQQPRTVPGTVLLREGGLLLPPLPHLLRRPARGVCELWWSCRDTNAPSARARSVWIATCTCTTRCTTAPGAAERARPILVCCFFGGGCLRVTVRPAVGISSFALASAALTYYRRATMHKRSVLLSVE